MIRLPTLNGMTGNRPEDWQSFQPVNAAEMPSNKKGQSALKASGTVMTALNYIER
jgi:hypothetical protein